MMAPNLTTILSTSEAEDDWLGLVDRCLPKPAGTDNFLSASGTWALVQNAREALPVLRRAIRENASSKPEHVRVAIEQALSRILWRSQRCDDADGELLQLLQAFIGVLNEALLKAPPPAAWGQWLLNTLIDAPSVGPTGCWNPAVTLEAAGVLVAQSYEQCLIQTWSRMQLGSIPTTVCDRLFELRVLALKQTGDVQTVMHFLSETASCEFTDAQLIDYAHSQGCHRDALRYAQAAVQRYPDSPRLQELLLRAYESCGVHARLALALRQDVFAREPNVANYQALLRAGEAAGVGISTLRKQAYAALAEHEKLGLKPAAVLPSTSRPGLKADAPGFSVDATPASGDGSGLFTTLTPESWWMVVRGPDVTVRVSLLLFEGHWQEALDWVAIPNVCQAGVLMDLANALQTKQTDDALALLDRAMRLDLASQPPRTEWALVRVATAFRRLALIEKTPTCDKKAALMKRLQGEFGQSHVEFVAGLARL